jgi:hypothetical protein
MQLVIVIFLKNESSVISQSQASTRAISGEFLASDKVITLQSPDRFQELKLLVTKDPREFPILLPGLTAIFGETIKSNQSGIAIIEAR